MSRRFDRQRRVDTWVPVISSVFVAVMSLIVLYLFIEAYVEQNWEKAQVLMLMLIGLAIEQETRKP